MKIKDLYKFMDEFAPFATACDFDNCGLLVGDIDAEITKIGMALDVTNAVIDEAVKLGINVIVSHHPVIFDPIKRLYPTMPAYRLIENNIANIAAHTNLDKAENGVNYVLAKYYGLKNVGTPLILDSLGRIGDLCPPMSATAYAKQIKLAIGADSVRYYDSGRPVKNVAYISGGGGRQFEEVLACNVDTFITGDIKHDQFVEAQNRCFNLIEANHFDSENLVMKPLAKAIKKSFPNTDVVVISLNNPIRAV